MRRVTVRMMMTDGMTVRYDDGPEVIWRKRRQTTAMPAQMQTKRWRCVMVLVVNCWLQQQLVLTAKQSSSSWKQLAAADELTNEDDDSQDDDGEAQHGVKRGDDSAVAYGTVRDGRCGRRDKQQRDSDGAAAI